MQRQLRTWPSLFRIHKRKKIVALTDLGNGRNPGPQSRSIDVRQPAGPVVLSLRLHWELTLLASEQMAMPCTFTVHLHEPIFSR